MCRLVWILILVCLLSSLPSRSSAQPADTTRTGAADSLSVLSPDTTGSGGASPENGETIQYASDLISYDVEDSLLVLTGNAVLKYGDVTLRAGQIRFNTFSEVLTAESLPDSSGLPADANPLPTLEDPQGTLVGDRMQYRLKTRQGRILHGRTRYEQGFFEGQQLRVEGENALKIDLGQYTTCDRPDHQHYWLRVGKAKVIPNDKAIVKNVTAYVYGVPVFYLPFYILPLKRGRHSGFTVPNYGTGAAEGTYVRNLGYFWAASDYWDLKLTGDFASATGFLVKPQLRYARARRLNGSVSASYQSTFGLRVTGWDVAASHWQELRPDLRIRGQAQFADRLAFVQSTTRGDDPGRLQPSLRSSLSIDKSWDQKSLNLSVSESSPDGKPVRPTTTLSFRLPTRPLFAPPERRRTNMPDFESTAGTSAPRAWYHAILFGYNGSLRDQKLTAGVRQEVAHQMNLSSQQTVGGWLQVQPQSSYSETWFRETGQGFDRQNVYSLGVRANTTLYGLFQPNLGRLKALRHVATPSVSFSQSGPRNVSRAASFALSNILQARTEQGGRERKFDLLFVNLSTAYNFKAPTRPLSDLFTSIRVPGRGVNVDASLAHDFYAPATGRLRRPWLESASLTTSVSLMGRGASPAGQPGMPGATAPGDPGASTPDDYPGSSDIGGRSTSGFGDDRYDEQFDRIKGPWSVSLTHRYTVSRSAPDTAFQTSSHLISVSNRFDLDTLAGLLGLSNPVTRKWRVEHAINYDIRRQEIVSHSFNFHRNLHCWELYVRWTPTGFNRGIYFRLNIIAHPEIKIEQQRLGR